MRAPRSMRTSGWITAQEAMWAVGSIPKGRGTSLPTWTASSASSRWARSINAARASPCSSTCTVGKRSRNCGANSGGQSTMLPGAGTSGVEPGVRSQKLSSPSAACPNSAKPDSAGTAWVGCIPGGSQSDDGRSLRNAKCWLIDIDVRKGIAHDSLDLRQSWLRVSCHTKILDHCSESGWCPATPKRASLGGATR